MTGVTAGCNLFSMAETGSRGYPSLMSRSALLLLALSSSLHAQLATPTVPLNTPRPAPLQAPASAATLESYEGSVEVETAGRRVALEDAPVRLTPGDRVLSGRRSKAQIVLADGSRVEVGANAQFTLEAQTAEKVSLFLEAGKVWVTAVKRRFRNFEVRTPVAVASVRGTRFSVEALERDAAVEVFEGSVAVFGGRGDQVLLGASQRIDVVEGRLGRPERFEGRYEDRGRGRAEPRKNEQKRAEPERREKMKAALEREVGHQLARENIERSAAFDMRNAVYQEGRTMIDAFGKRVRVEEYLTRPDPRSFKHITMNFREGRVDKSVFEVTANRELPRDLASVNLWFSPTAAQPAFWAARQRWTVTNGQDSAVQLSVDGVSRDITFPGVPIFDPGTSTFIGGSGPVTAHVTVFGNVYEFLNGDPGQIQAIWSNPLVRPLNGPGMMWHMIPVRMNINRVSDNVTLAHYWDYGFAVRSAAGATGRMFIDKSFAPNPSLAHFIERRNYIDFVDADANGVMNFDEPSIAASAAGNPFGTAVYHDKFQELNVAGAPVPFDGGTGVGTRDLTGDSVFFSDVNLNGLSDDGLLNTYTLGGAGPDPGLITFSTARARDWSTTENFVIDDEGRIFDFGSQFGTAKDSNDQGARIFQRLSYERAITSSRFGRRSIDIVMTPRLLLRAGQINTRPQFEGVEGPGPN